MLSGYVATLPVRECAATSIADGIKISKIKNYPILIACNAERSREVGLHGPPCRGRDQDKDAREKLRM